MNWDDLRIVSAIADRGTFTAAAASLRMDETTVARRLSRIQEALGGNLFDAVDGRRRPTALCLAILSDLREMERHASEIVRCAAMTPAVAGRIRLVATDAVAEEFLAPSIPALLDRYPGLTLEVMTGSGNVAFDKWEADLAIRLGRPEKGNFDRLRLCEIGLCRIEPRQAGETIVCYYPEAFRHVTEAKIMIEAGLADRARFLTANIRVIKTMLASGRCIGLLPDFLLGDLATDDRLRVTPLAQKREAWLLVQRHLKRDPTARAVIEWLKSCFKPVSP